MILKSLNEARPIEIMTIAGKEKGLVYLGKAFVADKSYTSLNDAILASRKDLDLGVGILIAPDAENFCVWVSVPNQMIYQVC